MNEIRVDVGPESKVGTLMPRLTDDGSMLVVESAASCDFIDHLAVDGGAVVFDAARGGVLARFDVLMREGGWPTSLYQAPPASSKRGTLIISQQSLEAHDLNIDVGIETDNERYLTIGLGQTRNWNEVVQLSEACFAFLESPALRGFYLALGGPV